MPTPPSPPSGDDPSPRLPASAPAISNDLPRESTRTILFQFVFFPLAIVLIAVGVFLLFGMLASEESSVRDSLNAIRSGSPQRRWQAAYQLSKSLDRGETAEFPDLHVEVEKLFESAGDDVALRRYLTLVLGKIGNPASIPTVSEALGSEDVETRIYALWSLGQIGDPRTLPAVIGALDDPEADVRKTAVYALGRLQDPRVIDPLAAALEDPVVDVRWNAALVLAQRGDRRSVPYLEEMLDRKKLDEVVKIRGDEWEPMREDQKEAAMLAAIEPWARLTGAEGRDVLERLAGSDPSLEVRSAAKAALR
ncbi:MAG TPA: HEAT repeat domain-containing protein [Thermoanaerobaculia bacterium]|nr:HEAT repeat domain-containing protein [Thermoanaerobaculia bacterium]